MPSTTVLHWPDDDVRARARTQAAADGAIAYLKMSGALAAGEQTMEDMIALGAPTGYLVDSSAEDDRTVVRELAEAGMVVIESGPSPAEARALLLGAAAEGIQASYKNGGVILAEGFSAMAFGAWVVQADGSLVPGLEWVDGALVGPGVASAAEWARAVLLAQPAAFAIGIGRGSALALGPDGQVQAWGAGQITIALGLDFIARGGSA